MTATHLTLRNRPGERLDLSLLQPAHLAALSAGEIERLPIGTISTGLVVGDVFALRKGDSDSLVLEGGSDRFDRLGAGLAGGDITILGDGPQLVGQLAGRGMTGGRLHIYGTAGPLAGSGMAGGRIDIDGDAGACLGGPQPGEMAGMRGGEIHVRGSAGERAGDRMRRGTITIAGNAGPLTGARMIAGTLAVGGAVGPGTGQLMRRGTIVLVAPGADMPASFVDNGPVELVFLSLLARLVPELPALPGRMARLGGDMAVLGKGEIILPGS